MGIGDTQTLFETHVLTPSTTREVQRDAGVVRLPVFHPHRSQRDEETDTLRHVSRRKER